jgi:hypothetical protein
MIWGTLIGYKISITATGSLLAMNQAFLYLEAIQRDTSNARIVDTMCQFQAIVTPVKYQAPIAKKEIFHP